MLFFSLFFLLFVFFFIKYSSSDLTYKSSIKKKNIKKQFQPGNDLWIIECYYFLFYPRSLPTGLAPNITSSTSLPISIYRSLSPSTWSIISPSTFLPVDLQIHGATDRPVTLIQLADVGAVNEPTARWQTDRWFFVFFGFGGGTILKSFFSHLTFRKVRNTARTLRTSKSTTSPCVIYISPFACLK